MTVAIEKQPEHQTPQELAVAYAEQGWPCFPCRHEAEDIYDPTTGELEERGPKTPLLAKGVNGAIKIPDVVGRAWGRYPNAMIGLPTGSATKFFVLDIDNKPGGANGFDWLAEMEANHGPLPETARVTTPNGGLHIYFNHADGVRNRGALGAGVDLRGEGGYVIGAGSKMADGRAYEWAGDAREIADAPAWLLDLVIPKPSPAHASRLLPTHADASRRLATTGGGNAAYVDAAVDNELAELSAAPRGDRNNKLNDTAFKLGRWVGGGYISESDARTWLQDISRPWGNFRKSCGTIESGLRAGKLDPRHPPESEIQADNTPPVNQEWLRRFIENSRRKMATAPVAANDNVTGVDGASTPARFSIFDWLSSRYVGDPPVVKELVEGTIPQGVPGMIAAMGDTGKSYAALELHRRVSFGSSTFEPPIFGGRVLATGTSVMVTSEDDAGEVHRRLAALDHKGHRFAEGGKLIVVPLPSAGGPQVFWREDKKRGLIETDDYKRLCDELLSIEDLRLVTFDPLASFAHVQINEDPAAGAFVCASLGALAAETKATVLVAHHMKKTGKPIENLADAREAIRGSTALVDGLRLAYALWPAEENRARAICRDLGVEYSANRVVFGGVVKANGAARRIVSTYVRNEFGLLVDRTSGVGASNLPQDDLLELLIAAVASAASAGQPFTKTGSTGLFDNKERLGEELGALSRHRIEALAQRAIDTQRVVKCIANGTTPKWLDVPTGRFAMGLGDFMKGMARG
jgi:hypothetical protein